MSLGGRNEDDSFVVTSDRSVGIAFLSECAFFCVSFCSRCQPTRMCLSVSLMLQRNYSHCSGKQSRSVWRVKEDKKDKQKSNFPICRKALKEFPVCKFPQNVLTSICSKCGDLWLCSWQIKGDAACFSGTFFCLTLKIGFHFMYQH